MTMERLAELLEAAGYSEILTYLASGNVLLEAPDGDGLEAALEQLFEAELGYDVPTFCRTRDELERALAVAPFGDVLAARDGEKVKRYTVLLRDQLTDDQAGQLGELGGDVDHFHAEGREIHWLRFFDAGGSIATSDIEKSLGVEATRRTNTTLERLLEKW